MAKPEVDWLRKPLPKAEKLLSTSFSAWVVIERNLGNDAHCGQKVRQTSLAESGILTKLWLRENWFGRKGCFIRSSTFFAEGLYVNCLPKNPRECRSPHGQRLKTWCYSAISRNCSARRSSSVAANKACCLSGIRAVSLISGTGGRCRAQDHAKSLVNTTSKTVVSNTLFLARPDIRHDERVLTSTMLSWAGCGGSAGNGTFELTPTYHFTEDGMKLHPNAEILLKGIKRMDNGTGCLEFPRVEDS